VVYPSIGWVSHAIKEGKKRKKGGKIRNLHIGLENGNKMEKCYKLLFYSYLQLKKKKMHKKKK
jgi:hypothetical protein